MLRFANRLGVVPGHHFQEGSLEVFPVEGRQTRHGFLLTTLHLRLVIDAIPIAQPTRIGTISADWVSMIE